MSRASDPWRPVTTLDDLWSGEMRGLEIDGAPIVVVNLAGEIYAYVDRCPHSGQPLSKGSLDGHLLTCAAHEWSFDCRSGVGVNPATAVLHRLEVRVEDEVVSVRSLP